MWILFNPTNPVSKCFFVCGGDHIDLSESVPNPANVEKCLSVWAEGRGKSSEAWGREGAEKGMMWPLRGCRVAGGLIYSLLLGEGNPNSRTPFIHTLQPSRHHRADGPRTWTVVQSLQADARAANSLLRLFTAATLVLFPARPLFPEKTQIAAYTVNKDVTLYLDDPLETFY